MSYLFVGIDPGSHCGWAVLDEQGQRHGSGTWDLVGSRFEGGGMRFLRLRGYLQRLLDDCAGHLVAVGVEEVHQHEGTDAAHIYGGILAQITSLCEERQVPYLGIPVATIKAYATGKGNAGKEQVVAAAQQQWDRVVDDDNEADALWVGESLRRELGFGGADAPPIGGRTRKRAKGARKHNEAP